MPNLLDKTTLASAIERVSSLDSDDTAKFGKFSVERMVCHIIDSLEISYGLKGPQKAKKSFYSSALGKWFIISAPIPWPKGKIEAPLPIFLETAPSDSFEKDTATLVGLLRKMESAEQIEWTESPAFGELTPKQWGTLHYRHADHHLAQFGR